MRTRTKRLVVALIALGSAVLVSGEASGASAASTAPCYYEYCTTRYCGSGSGRIEEWCSPPCDYRMMCNINTSQACLETERLVQCTGNFYEP